MAEMKCLVGSAFAAALLLFGCGDPSPRTTGTAGDPVSTVPPSGIPPESTTTTAALIPTATSGPPTTGGGVRAGWETCTNTQRGYSIGHPSGWHTAHGCRYLDPEPLDIPPNSDGFFSALAVVAGDTSFDQARRRADDRFFVLILREETTVGQRRAVRYEAESTGEGLFDKGSRLYSLIIDNDGRAFEVLTAWFPGTPTSDYQARKKLVDEVVKTVEFL